MKALKNFAVKALVLTGVMALATVVTGFAGLPAILIPVVGVLTLASIHQD